MKYDGPEIIFECNDYDFLIQHCKIDALINNRNVDILNVLYTNLFRYDLSVKPNIKEFNTKKYDNLRRSYHELFDKKLFEELYIDEEFKELMRENFDWLACYNCATISAFMFKAFLGEEDFDFQYQHHLSENKI